MLSSKKRSLKHDSSALSYLHKCRTVLSLQLSLQDAKFATAVFSLFQLAAILLLFVKRHWFVTIKRCKSKHGLLSVKTSHVAQLPISVCNKTRHSLHSQNESFLSLDQVAIGKKRLILIENDSK